MESNVQLHFAARLKEIRDARACTKEERVAGTPQGD